MLQTRFRLLWLGLAVILNGLVLGVGVRLLSAESPTWETLHSPATVVEVRPILSRLPTPSTRTTHQLNTIARPERPTAQAVSSQSPATILQPRKTTTPTVCTVTRQFDLGPGTLRDCLDDLTDNYHIVFDATAFPADTPMTITLATELPPLRAATNVLLDASGSHVVLDGNNTVPVGLSIAAAQTVTVRGLHVVNFEMDGIEVHDNATNITVGGSPGAGRTTIGEGNRVADNGRYGVHVHDGAFAVTVAGNWIGLSVSGQMTAGNRTGIFVSIGVSNTVIASNTVSGNRFDGIRLQRADNNRMIGNRIGTNPTGDLVLPNREAGIYVSATSNGNIIGGEAMHERNLISGNGLTGVLVDNGWNTIIRNNYIGTDVTGENALPNEYGIIVGFGSTHTVIADNLIGGNNVVGVQIGDAGTTSTTLTGNWIGISADGTEPLPNETGIGIFNGATHAQIGGPSAAERNVVSGNSLRGIAIQGETTAFHTIEGNYIGTDATGQQSVGNATVGIDLFEGTNRNRILHNTISGNGAGETCDLAGGFGISMMATQFITVQSNYIGTDPTGSTAVHNSLPGILIGAGSTNNLIGGSADGEGNVVSGNAAAGIVIFGAGASHNRVEGNLVGVNASGIASIPNENSCQPYPDLVPDLFIDEGAIGVGIGNGASHNTIGGALTGTRNIISGQWHGVEISGTVALTTAHNRISGNFIGTNIHGNASVPVDLFTPRPEVGVFVAEGSHFNVIGGETAGERNIVSGNQFGIQVQGANVAGNMVRGNYVGTDAGGNSALSNQVGIVVAFGAQATMVVNNVASGNEEVGIGVAISETQFTKICGNSLGLSADHTTIVANLTAGIEFQDSTSNNTVGNSAENCAGNWIGGNGGPGILLRGNTAGLSHHVVADNLVGVDRLGGIRPNQGAGIELSDFATNNLIGPNNIVRHNIGAGILLKDNTTLNNRITRNVLYQNSAASIDWNPPVPVSVPHFMTFATGQLRGQACANCIVEIFSSPGATAEAWEYVTQTIANSDGQFETRTVAAWPYLTATATDPTSNTSELSESLLAFSINDPSMAAVSETVTFTLSTTDENLTYTWSFGDGSTALSPTHTYLYPAVYQVVVTGTGATVQVTATASITVTDAEIPTNINLAGRSLYLSSTPVIVLMFAFLLLTVSLHPFIRWKFSIRGSLP